MARSIDADWITLYDGISIQEEVPIKVKELQTFTGNLPHPYDYFVMPDKIILTYFLQNRNIEPYSLSGSGYRSDYYFTFRDKSERQQGQFGNIEFYHRLKKGVGTIDYHNGVLELHFPPPKWWQRKKKYLDHLFNTYISIRYNYEPSTA